MKLFLSLFLLTVAVSLSAQDGSTFPTNVFLKHLPGSGDHVAVRADGLLMRTNIAGGSGTPGGSTFSLQYNGTNTLAGDTNFTYVPFHLDGGDPISPTWFLTYPASGVTNFVSGTGGFGTLSGTPMYLTTSNSVRWILGPVGTFYPNGSNLFSIGTHLLPAATNYAQHFSAKDGMDIAGGGGAIIGLKDADGTNVNLRIPNMDGFDAEFRWFKNTNAGVMVSLSETGTNQFTNITLTAGQVVTHNGSTYVAASLNASGIDTSWVATNGNDSTARLNVQSLPFLTLNNAIIATRTNGGLINVGAGRFLSPTPLLLVTDHTNNPGTNLLTIRGSGKPFPNTNYTTLLEGKAATVFEGPFMINRPRVHVENCGIDVGKVVVDASFGGTAQEGLLWHSFQQENWTTNTINYDSAARQVSVLSYETNSAVHALLFENVVDGTLEDIDTWMATHGVIIKAMRVVARGIRTAGHISNGFIVKINSYAAPGLRIPGASSGVSDIMVSDLLIRRLRVNGDCGPLRIDNSNEVDYIANVQVSGYTSYGLQGIECQFNNGATYFLNGCRISHVSANGTRTNTTGHANSEVYVNNFLQ